MAILGDYIRIKHGFAFKGDYITTEDNGVVLVTPGNFEIGGGFKEKKCKFFSAEYPADYVLHAGDLIVTMTDLSKQGDTLGFSALVPNSNRTYLHNQRIGLVDVFNPEADKDYIYWFMRTPYYQKTIVAAASGSTVKHTSPSRICDVEIELPSLDEQKKISSILRSIDDKIENNQKINDNLQQQVYALFDSWFVSFNQTDGKMPADWREGTLGEITTITSGKRPPMKQPTATTEVSIPLVGAASIMGFTNAVLYNEPILVTGRVGTHGVVQRFQSPCWTSDNTLVIKSEFYEYAFQALQRVDYVNMNRGSTQPLITQTDLKNVSIVIPTEAILLEYEKITGTMMAMYESNRKENERLAVLRDTLLPRLMNGEIDVSNIEI